MYCLLELVLLFKFTSIFTYKYCFKFFYSLGKYWDCIIIAYLLTLGNNKFYIAFTTQVCYLILLSVQFFKEENQIMDHWHQCIFTYMKFLYFQPSQRPSDKKLHLDLFCLEHFTKRVYKMAFKISDWRFGFNENVLTQL